MYVAYKGNSARSFWFCPGDVRVLSGVLLGQKALCAQFHPVLRGWHGGLRSKVLCGCWVPCVGRGQGRAVQEIKAVAGQARCLVAQGERCGLLGGFTMAVVAWRYSQVSSRPRCVDSLRN